MTNRLSESPSLEEVLSWAMETRLANVFRALPGKVNSYNNKTQTADIKPLLRHNVQTSDGGELVESIPVLRDVPIIFPRGGGHFISFPIKKDDKVLIVFCDRNIDQYMRQDQTVNPDGVDPLDLEIGGLNGAVAIPGFFPEKEQLSSTDADSDNMVLGLEGGTSQVHIGGDQINLYEKIATDFVALAQKVFDEINALRTTVAAHTTEFDGHVHTSAAAGSPTSNPTVAVPPTSFSSPPAVNSVAADKVRAT